MKQMKSLIATAATVAVCLSLSSAPAIAQFACGAGCHIVGGAVSDATTGPFIAGDTYIVTSNLSVPGGSTLTVGAGTIVKFSGSVTFTISGTLVVNGAPGNEAIFTSIHDDVGGDHNNNGAATSPAPGQWGRLLFSSTSDLSVVQHAIVRYAGASFNPAFDLTSADVALTGCTATDVSGPGLSLGGNSFPTVTNCAFNNGSKAVANAPLQALAGFVGCTASGNSTYDAIEVTVGVAGVGTSVLKSNATNADGVFIMAGTTTIATASSLTLGPGVKFKYSGNFLCDVDGVLTTNGSSGDPVVFTSIHDDVHGGDSNKNGGTTSGAAAQWSRVDFGPTSDASSLTHTIVRCAGTSFNSALDLNQADVTLTSVSTDLLAGPCLDLSDNSFPTVTSCAFNGGSKAATLVPIGALPGFSGNTAAGNSVYDAPELGSMLVSSNLTLAATSSFNADGVFVVVSTTTITTGTTLTLGAGMIFKMAGNHLVLVDGTLAALGSSGAPVVFTSLHDDVHGGDTNKNGGASSGAPAQWSRLDFNDDSDASVLQNVVVRCAGTSFNSAIDLFNSNATLDAVATDLLAGPCLTLRNNSFPTATNCVFNGGTRAVTQTPIGAIAGFSGCTASGNSQYDAHVVEAATVSGAATITAANSMNGSGVFVISATVTIPAAQSLTLGAGVVFKFDANFAVVTSGTLLANGTEAAPVVFTSIHDDVHGGDANKNGGASVGSPAQWSRLDFDATSGASTLDYAIVRCAGSSFSAAFDLSNANITLRNCSTSLLAGSCIDLNQNSEPTVISCALNGGVRPVDAARIDGLSGFRFNTASGNSAENAPRVTTATLAVGESATLDRINTCNADGVVVMATTTTVQAGGSLVVGRGVRFKMAGNFVFDVSGNCELRGTGHDPIVFTSLHDDTIGGDTNLNLGATLPAPATYSRVRFLAGSTGIADYVNVRYAGSSFSTAFQCLSNGVYVRSVRAERCAGDGILVSDCFGGIVDNLVAWNNGLDGIEYGAPVSLRHPTSADNGAFGVRGTVATPGTIINGIVKFNTSGAFTSVPSTQVSFTCGLTGGGTGNFDSDPLFVDGPNGDLNLQLGSPCVDVADALTGFVVVTDHVAGSRLSDGQLLGAPFPDMGAYELSPYRFVVTGEPWSETTVTMEVIGPPGIAAIAIGNLNGTELLIPYGFSLADFIPLLVPLTFVSTNTPFVFFVPDISAYVGTPFGMQALGTTLADPTKGAFTNLYRGVLDG